MQLDEIREKIQLVTATSFGRKYNVPVYAIRQLQKGKDIRASHLVQIISGLKDMGK